MIIGIQSPDGRTLTEFWYFGEKCDYVEGPIRFTVVMAYLGEQLLFVYNPRRRYWELPGGKLEIDELPEDCVKRELLEEAGIMGECFETKAIFQTQYMQDRPLTGIVYKCKIPISEKFQSCQVRFYNTQNLPPDIGAIDKVLVNLLYMH
jgi:8-oxo-dGTP pyrophosphatase MutT (NUDIX family)